MAKQETDWLLKDRLIIAQNAMTTSRELIIANKDRFNGFIEMTNATMELADIISDAIHAIGERTRIKLIPPKDTVVSDVVPPSTSKPTDNVPSKKEKEVSNDPKNPTTVVPVPTAPQSIVLKNISQIMNLDIDTVKELVYTTYNKYPSNPKSVNKIVGELTK